MAPPSYPRTLPPTARWLVWLLVLVPGLAQAAIPLSGAWRPATAGDTPAAVLAEARAGKLTPFDPSRMQTFPFSAEGAWVVLRPEAVPASSRILSIPWPMFGRITLYDAHGPIQTTEVEDSGTGLPGYGRLAFRLPDTWPSTAPVLLKFKQAAMFSEPVTFRMQSPPDYRHSEALWLGMASACFGVMLAMAAMALCFALMLGDFAFVWYAGYVSCYVLVQCLQSGFLFRPLGLGTVVGNGLAFGLAAAAGSLCFATLFALRFCNLARHAPRLRIAMVVVVILVGILITLRLPPIEPLRQFVQVLINPVLALTAMLILSAAALAAWHRERAAWFFLAGWTPLLAMIALANAQVNGALPGVDWLHDACIVTAALESVVLSIGLADRALTMRRDRDRARELANRDALTGLFNRRAWTEAVEKRLGGGHKPGLALLFLDLDNFKMLNDRYGHAAGDGALLALADVLRDELRPGDLFGRFGGEEFVALLERLDHADALQVAARLCRRVNRMAIPVDNHGTLLTVSIGAALWRTDDTVVSLVERADKAMYAAKATGRNRVVWERPNGSFGAVARYSAETP
jgi:diguanylate cyclase (GGDEF)-like protein